MKKRLIAVVLLVAMALSLVACSANDSKKLVGTWACKMDLADQINLEMNLDELMARYLSIDSFEIKMYAEFYDDGTYAFYADESTLKDTVEKMKDSYAVKLEGYLVDMIYEQLGMEMSVDEVLELMGVSMDELLDEVLTDDLVDEIVESMARDGKYKAEDGKLYLSAGRSYDIDTSEYEMYTLEGSTLTLTGYVGSGMDGYENIYPMVFKKVG